ncbi:aminotransferase class V-fold PLP-dependent enzyme [bacterium]|nr:aminotransferase class V-fold PLP-dependent enzyme [bacterium]
MIDGANVRKYRELMAVCDEWTFLNHAATSPITKPAREAMIAFLSDLCANAVANRARWLGQIREARVLAADLLHCSPQEIAFVKNTSEGISTIANGLNLSPVDNVVTTDIEFPTNIYPWMRFSPGGASLKFVQNTEGRVPFQDIEEATDDNTRVIALSSVEFSTGFRHDLRRIGEFCRERGIFFFVDGIQSVGALELDVKGCCISALSAASHKWLLGPQGTGILFVEERVLEEVEPTEVGWNTVENAEEYLEYRFAPKKDACKFECGSLNLVGIAGMAASVRLLLEVGIRNIENHIIQLTDQLCGGLEKKGYEIYSSREVGEKSGIVLFSSPTHPAEDLCRRLLEKKIITSVRYGRVRVSPHFYNTPEEMEKVIETLP